MNIVPIVEGDGEVAALPVLLRRLNEWKRPGTAIDISHPIRVRKDRFLRRDDEFSRHVQLACLKAGVGGLVLILLDADDDCPVVESEKIRSRALCVNATGEFAVIMANREYEAWFIAAAPSLSGRRGFVLPANDSSHLVPETRRDAKGWIRERMSPNGYRETRDQAAFSAHLDLELAFQNSRSFRKLCTEFGKFAARTSAATQ